MRELTPQGVDWRQPVALLTRHAPDSPLSTPHPETQPECWLSVRRPPRMELNCGVHVHHRMHRAMDGDRIDNMRFTWLGASRSTMPTGM
jgi:hypothetical protein